MVTRVESGQWARDLDASDETIELRFRSDGRMEAIRNGLPWSTYAYDVGLRRVEWSAGFVTLRVRSPRRTAPDDAGSRLRLSLVRDHIVVFRVKG